MITKEKICKEIENTLEHGRMTSQCVADLAALYYIQGRISGGEHHKDMDMETARKWVDRMRNADGSTGEHWTLEQTSKVLRDKDLNCPSMEFYATINMMWSDYAKVAEKFGVNNLDFWSEMALAFLKDEDAAPDKLARYYDCVVSK